MQDWRKESMQARKKYAQEYVQNGVSEFCNKQGFATQEQVKIVKNDAANIYANTRKEYNELWDFLDPLFTV